MELEKTVCELEQQVTEEEDVVAAREFERVEEGWLIDGERGSADENRYIERLLMSVRRWIDGTGKADAEKENNDLRWSANKSS